MKLVVVDETSSTNELVKDALREGKAEGLIVRARRQSSGYGRQGRGWDSPEGGLYMSLLLRPNVSGSGLATLSLVVGLAVQSALSAVAAPRCKDGIQLKWPNDVVYLPSIDTPADEYHKLCGISLETCAGGVCVGVGVNVFRPDIDQPVEGRNVPSYMAELMPVPGADPAFPETVAQATQSLTGRALTSAREQVITDIQREIVARILVGYGRWRELGFAPSQARYASVSFLNGRAVRIEGIAGEVMAEGAVEGVDDRGRLLVRTADGIVPVSSGEAHVFPVA